MNWPAPFHSEVAAYLGNVDRRRRRNAAEDNLANYVQPGDTAIIIDEYRNAGNTKYNYTGTVAGDGDPLGLVLNQAYMSGKTLASFLAGQTELWLHANVTYTGESEEVSEGVYRLYSSVGDYSAVNNNSIFTSGLFYFGDFEIDSVTTPGSTQFRDDGVTFSAVGDYEFVYLAGGSHAFFKRVGSVDLQISGVSLKAVPANHPFQLTDGNRAEREEGDGWGDVNLLLETFNPFNTTYWSTSNCTLEYVDGFGSEPTAFRVTVDSTTNTSFLNTTAVGIAKEDGAHCFSVLALKGSGATEANTFRFRNTTTATDLLHISIDYDTGDITYLVGSSGATAVAISGETGAWTIEMAVSSGVSVGDVLRGYIGLDGNVHNINEYMDYAAPQINSGTERGTFQRNDDHLGGVGGRKSGDGRGVVSLAKNNIAPTEGEWTNTNVSITEITGFNGHEEAFRSTVDTTSGTSLHLNGIIAGDTTLTYAVDVRRGSGDTDGDTFLLRNLTTATNLLSINLDYSDGSFIYTTGSTGVTVTAIDGETEAYHIVMTHAAGITVGDEVRGYIGDTGGSAGAGEYFDFAGFQVVNGAVDLSHQRTLDWLGGVGPWRSTDNIWIQGNGTSWYLENEPFLSTASAFTLIFLLEGVIDASSGNLEIVYSEANDSDADPKLTIRNGAAPSRDKLCLTAVDDAGTTLVGVADTLTTSSVFDGVPHVCTLIYDGSNIIIRVDGTQEVNFNSGALSGVTMNTATIMARDSNGTVSGYYGRKLGGLSLITDRGDYSEAALRAMERLVAESWQQVELAA